MRRKIAGRNILWQMSAIVHTRPATLPRHPGFLPFEHRVRILILVEGMHDIEFLKRISLVLQDVDSHLPDLGHLERTRQLVFLPTGGNPAGWINRLAALQRPEFHLADGETHPTTETRHQIAEAINKRSRCRAFVTRHRSLENYLHPAAIDDVSGSKVEFSGTDDVPALVAQDSYEALLPTTPWSELPPRSRKRACERAKKWLNTDAVSAMTPDRLAECDPHQEVLGWMSAIADLMQRG